MHINGEMFLGSGVINSKEIQQKKETLMMKSNATRECIK